MALSIMLGRRFPKLFSFTDRDVDRLFPCMEKLVVESIKESGYMHIQATKPDTVGKNQSQRSIDTSHLLSLIREQPWVLGDAASRLAEGGSVKYSSRHQFGCELCQVVVELFSRTTVKLIIDHIYY